MPVASGSKSIAAARISLTGCVQGSGVRPSVVRLATSLELKGSVRNTSAGLEIEVEGSAVQITMFQQRLLSSLPPGSAVEQIDVVAIAALQRSEFAIERDDTTGPLKTQVPRDVVVCDDCMAEIRDQADRRFSYPLTTCATCGPRFSLIEEMPFGRARTTMDAFSMCDDCRAEYTSLDDRRYHAQTIGCEKCGPQVWLVEESGGTLETGSAAAASAARLLLAGKILAMRGVGGYQLLCDATSLGAVERLRCRKARPTKPFAVLVGSLEEARAHAIIDELESDALTGRSNPIVLLRAAPGEISVSVHPGLNRVGLMLPSTPLHSLVCEAVERPLVCTSANREGEPLEHDVEAAECNLVGIADAWLHHDRPIACPIEDSVVQVIAGRCVTLRLGRGLAPLPLDLPVARPQLAVGGHMKSAIAWHNGAQAVLGPHLGDLDTVATRERFEQQVAGMSSLYRFEPEAAVHDLHPDYFASRYCHDLAAMGRKIETLGVQHHFAHVAAGMLEHGLLDREVLGVSWDGTGFGEDGTIWGGEFLVVDGVERYRRVAHLRPFRWFGGEIAIRQPWRVAVSLLSETFSEDTWIEQAATLWTDRPISSLRQMNRQRSSPTLSTSVGRLFDAVAAIILGIDVVQYEGQAAMMLESAASSYSLGGCSNPHARWPFKAVDHQHRKELTDSEGHRTNGIKYPDKLPEGYSFPLASDQLDWRPILRGIWEDRLAGVAPEVMSARFHRSLASGIVAVAAQFPEFPIVLAGGVFQNKLLTELVVDMMDERERLKLPGRIPPNDGGLAAGQLAIAVMRERAGLHQPEPVGP